MRPRAIAAASPKPTPTATRTARDRRLTVSSSPPISDLISGGSSDSTTMPTSQNPAGHQRAPPQPRIGAQMAIIAAVEATMLATL